MAGQLKNTNRMKNIFSALFFLLPLLAVSQTPGLQIPNHKIDFHSDVSLLGAQVGDVLTYNGVGISASTPLNLTGIAEGQIPYLSGDSLAGSGLTIDLSGDFSSSTLELTGGAQPQIRVEGSVAGWLRLGTSSNTWDFTGLGSQLRIEPSTTDGTIIFRKQDNTELVSLFTNTGIFEIESAGVLRVTGKGGTATVLTGFDSTNEITDITLGTGLTLSSGVLSSSGADGNGIYSGSGTLPDTVTALNGDGAGFEVLADGIDIRGVEVTVNGAPLSIRPKDTLNVAINAVMPQMSLGGGFESLNDGQYTEGSPLSIPAGDTVAVTITGGTALRSYLPPGYDSLYNRTTQRFEPTLVGENWMVRLNYKAKSTNNDGDVTIYMDIGDGTTPNYITGRVKRLPRGTGDEHQFSSTDAIFNLGTFVANGGRFVVVGGVGTTTIYDISISFYRVSTPHGQVNVGDTPGYWTVPDDLVDAEIIGVQYAFRTAHSGGTIDMQLSDGTVGFAGTTIADGDRVQSLDLSGTPVSLTSERLIQPVAVSSTATTLPKGLIVNLTIVK